MQKKLNIKTYLKDTTTWNTKHAKESYLIGGYRLQSFFATCKRKNTTYPPNLSQNIHILKITNRLIGVKP
jgi:hypothetical protein